MNILGQIPAESPTVLLIAIGMGVALFLIYGFIVGSQFIEEDKSAAVPNSREGYKHFEEAVA